MTVNDLYWQTKKLRHQGHGDAKVAVFDTDTLTRKPVQEPTSYDPESGLFSLRVAGKCERCGRSYEPAP